MTGINDFAKAMSEAFEQYSAEAVEASKAAIDRVAKGADEAIKSHISFRERTGRYRKNMRIVTSHDGLYDRRKTWYVKSPDYRLTHLLEYGHLSRDGTTRVKPYEHIRYGEEYVRQNLEKEVKRSLEQIRH